MMRKSLLGLTYGLMVVGVLGLLPLVPGVGGPEVALAQATPPPVDIGVIGRYTTNATAPRKAVTLVQITNLTNLLPAANRVTCEIGMRWVSNDGVTTCTIAPLPISSGETKEFCSRSVDPTTMLSLCNGGSCNGAQGTANQDLGTSNGVAYVTMSAASFGVIQCADLTNILVDPRTLYTEGEGNQTTVKAADNPRAKP